MKPLARWPMVAALTVLGAIVCHKYDGSLREWMRPLPSDPDKSDPLAMVAATGSFVLARWATK